MTVFEFDDEGMPTDNSMTEIENVKAFLSEYGFKPILVEAVIYALFQDEICQYIGSTKRLYMRLTRHLTTKRFPFNKVLVKTVPLYSLLTEEMYLIGLINPPFNIDGTTNARAPRPTKQEHRQEAIKLLKSAGLKE